MENITRNDALALLGKRPEENIAYINFIENNPVTEIYQCGESIMFRGESDRNWVYINCDNQEELQDLVSALSVGDQNFALVQAWMLPIISKGRKPTWQMISEKLVLPLTAILPGTKTKAVSLKPEHAEEIYHIWPYRDVTTLEYTRDRISRGHSAAIFQDGVPVAWAITHDDGAIGFLYVREGYRGKGYAQDVTLALANQLRRLHKPAFVHIEPDNLKSLSLASKLGFVQEGQVMWVGY